MDFDNAWYNLFHYLRSNCRYTYRGWQYNYVNTVRDVLGYKR